MTHLEIIYAALDAGLRGDSIEPFFYFRDRAALPRPEDIGGSADERQAYAAAYFQAPPAPGDRDLRVRLATLKSRIRHQFGPAGRVA